MLSFEKNSSHRICHSFNANGCNGLSKHLYHMQDTRDFFFFFFFFGTCDDRQLHRRVGPTPLTGVAANVANCKMLPGNSTG